MFKKGVSGNKNGRPKGTARKLIDAPALMRDRNYCPITHAIDLILDKKTTTKEKIDLIKMLADKSAPNLKAIEHKTDDTQHDEMLDSLKTVMIGLASKFTKDH
jgi:hypothetical protein